MASKSAEGKEPNTRGTGNVFADLGFPDAAERQAKLRLAYALNQVLEARKLSQADAAKVLGVTQPKVSALRRYKLQGFSVERRNHLAWSGGFAPGPLHTLSLAASTARSGRVRDFASLVAISRSRRSAPAFALPVVAQRAKAGVNRS